MVCYQCRHKDHHACESYRLTPVEGLEYVEKSWCDCQHKREGINRELMRLNAKSE